MDRLKLTVSLLFLAFAVIFYAPGLLTPETGAAVGGGDPGAPAAPTGVTASDEHYADKVGIIWDTMRGATLYRVFRATTDDPAAAVEIGSSASNRFFDATAQPGQIYFYWVRAVNAGAAASGFSQSDEGRRGAGSGGGGPFPPLDPPPAPAENPVTAAKNALGKALFWDEQMSSTRTVACGTCHGPSSGGSDGRSLSEALRSANPGFDGVFGNNDDITGSAGVILNNADGTYNLSAAFGFKEQTTGRKANTFINAAYAPELFWDGRATSEFNDPVSGGLLIASGGALESQVAGPPASPVEMAHTGRDWNQVAARIRDSKPLALSPAIPAELEIWIGGRSYPELFAEAYGTPEVTAARIAMAIASYERNLFSDQTPLDRAAAQIEPLRPAEERGRQLFVQLQCNLCHDGSLLSDNLFHNIGVRPAAEDTGRAQVTGKTGDEGKFRTPTLRNVELRAPYMHNGRFQTLEEVVEFYDRGGDFDAPNIDRGTIRPLNMTDQQKADLVAFLKRPLTDPRVAGGLPPFNSPTLYTQSDRVPQITAAPGRAGSGGLVPRVVAIEPPLAGNPSFTVGVSEALGGAAAVLVIDRADPGVGTEIPATGSFARTELTLSGAGGGAGYGSVSLQIPATPAVIGQTFFGRWYVADPNAPNGFAVSRAFRFTVFGEAAGNRAKFDFEGDGRTDIGIWRPGPGEWWYLQSSDGQAAAFQFGTGTDRITPADFTGDGRADIAFFRPGTGEWFVLRSEDASFYSFPFGGTGDIPAPGDFDGDGRADPAVFRPAEATWYILNSSGGTTIRQFGLDGDVPIPADYDGDGTDDIAVFRPSAAEWYLDRSTAGFIGYQFGQPGSATPVPADYTGDGTADVAFFNPNAAPGASNWFVLRSDDESFFAFPFGVGTDVPVPGDYDGDGRSDPAVFRPSNNTWFLQQTTDGFEAVGFGIQGDVPIPSAYRPAPQ